MDARDFALDARPANGQGTLVVDRARPCAVKVPSWFTAWAAVRVAQLKQIENLLVEERGVVVGVVSRKTLAAAAPNRPVAAVMVSSTIQLPAEMALAEAERIMSTLDVDCLPVVSGSLLVGVLRREDLGSAHELRSAG